MRKLNSNHGITRNYAEVKTHKPDRPIWPIIFSINIIKIGVEKVILEILGPINKNPHKSVENTEHLKIEF